MNTDTLYCMTLVSIILNCIFAVLNGAGNGQPNLEVAVGVAVMGVLNLAMLFYIFGRDYRER